MQTRLYNKPYRTPADLVNDLKLKKLGFHDEDEAENILSQISYYRFKIYLHPLLDVESRDGKLYRKDEYFEYGLELYRFDEKLRVLLFGIIARLEIKLRSRLDHTLSSCRNNPFWYLDNTYFYTKKGTDLIDSIRKRIQFSFNQEQELYAKNYRGKYHNNIHPQFTDLPPFWVARQNRPYLTVCMMHKMIKTLGMEGINLKAEIMKLFAENDTAKIYRVETGFPQDWETDFFWG
ncbi:Abi family protein [Klebsiella sp. BIGb0407]|uniref:Abi family protein n=1 Tax=Klebsiella sp. BIGb0407 TaxID=2940603 RepID=UPI00216A0F66|nr:Abi family protein [Klebsiella sp. BIGb0407]MCS3430689.1 abortive infection bacteriophage resistance protein [Klebsiella sp. BIGb0407]